MSIFFVLLLNTPCFSQVELRLGTVYPVRVGTNFLNEGYQSNFGASTELNFPIYKNWFGQIAYCLFHARVNNPESVGFIAKTGVTHVHVA